MPTQIQKVIFAVALSIIAVTTCKSDTNTSNNDKRNIDQFKSGSYLDMVSLRDYFDMRIENLDRTFDSRIQALDRATTIASVAMEKRLEGMNEFRAQLKDQTAQFVTRNEYQLSNEKTSADLKALQGFQITQEAKASQNSVLYIGVMSLIGLCISIFGIFWKARQKSN